MNWFTISLVLIISSIIFVDLQQPSSVAINNKKTFFDKSSLNTEEIGETLDRLHCSNGWTQFNYSCYLLFDHMSTFSQANATCYRGYSNISQLMYIEKPVELLYAANVLIKHDLNNLLLEFAPDLLKNGKIVNILSSKFNYSQWNEFERRKIQENTLTSNNSNKQFENINSIRKPCDEYQWNVINENFNTLILSIKIDSNKSICSLSNININAAYHYLCQYSLDRCRNNNKCGKHGECINTLTNFKCICSLVYVGEYCDKFSSLYVQIIVGFIVILLLLIESVRNKFVKGIIWFILYILSKFQSVLNLLWKPLKRFISSKMKKDTQHSDATNQTILFELNSVEERNRRWFVVGLSGVIFVIPFVYLLISSLTHKKNEMNSSLNNQYRRNTVFQKDYLGFFVLSIVTSIILTIFNIKYHKNDENYMAIIEPIKPFYITNRFPTAVIVLIQIFEILEVIDETRINIQQASQSGVFAKILTRFVFVIINAFRYYPVLASLQFQEISMRILVSIYFIANFIHMIFRENIYLYWLASLEKISLLDQKDFYVNMHYGSLIYSVIKYAIYYGATGYICAELIVRAGFDSIYITYTIRNNTKQRSKRNIDEYSFSKNKLMNIAIGANENTSIRDQNQKSNKREYWSRIEKFLARIYRWEEDFRLTTVVVCTYTIAYIILIQLAFNIVFFYTTNGTTYLTNLIQLIERLLNIEIEQQSFQTEVIISAIITAFITGFQLLLSTQNYKDSVRKLYKICLDDNKPGFFIEENEIIPKSIQYPAFLLRYLLGGYLICFHSLLFTMIGLNTITKQIASFKLAIISLLSIICVYGLHKIISVLSNELFINYKSKNQTNNHSYSQDPTNADRSLENQSSSHSENQSSSDPPSKKKESIKLNRPYSILLYLNLISSAFISIISSVFRLIASFFVNILFLPRIDYSCFPSPLQKFDSACVSFECFIRWELLYTYPLILQFSKVTRPVNSTTIAVLCSESQPSPDGDETPSEAATDELTPLARGTQQNNIPILDTIEEAD